MSKQSKNKKKLGYNQYEKLLVLAHKKADILAERCKELQTYFMAYVEYRGDSLEFNEWITKRIRQEQEEAEKPSEVHEKV